MYVVSFRKDVINNVPLAIQVELRFCEHVYGVLISPITCAYYLMFLCYHELRRKENRDRALRLLMTVVNSPELCERHMHHSFNTAGHCCQASGAVHGRCLCVLTDTLIRKKTKYTKNTILPSTTCRIYLGRDGRYIVVFMLEATELS